MKIVLKYILNIGLKNIIYCNMIQDINSIVMTPLTIVVLLIISVALLFVTIYLSISVRDLKDKCMNILGLNEQLCQLGEENIKNTFDICESNHKIIEESRHIHKNNEMLIKALDVLIYNRVNNEKDNQ